MYICGYITGGINSIINPCPLLHNSLDHACDRFFARNVYRDNFHFDVLVCGPRLIINDSLGLSQAVLRPVTDRDLLASFGGESNSSCAANAFLRLALLQQYMGWD